MVDGAYGGELEKRKTVNFPPALFRCREPDVRPCSIITIAPAEDLGGFLRGTLNFRGKKARAWMEQVYRDARVHLHEIRAAVEGLLQ